jgi:hypothetical protein
MQRVTDLKGLFQEANAIRNVLGMSGLEVDIFKVREILAHIYEEKSWDFLVASCKEKDEGYKDDLYVILSYAMRALVSIAFQEKAGKPTPCRLLGDQRTGQLYGIEFDSPCNPAPVKFTVDEHTREEIGFLFGCEIAMALTPEEDRDSLDWRPER